MNCMLLSRKTRLKRDDTCTDSDLETVCEGFLQLFAQGSTFSGLNPSGLAFVHYQCNGNRVFATVSLKEAYSATKVETYKDVVEAISKIDPSSDYKLPSLRTGYLSAGDILYVPAGHVCFERAVNAHNSGFRVMCPLFAPQSMDDLKLVDDIYPKKLGLYIMQF